MYVSRLKRTWLALRGVLGHRKRPKPRIVAKRSARALRAGGRNVTIVTTMNLDRLQVHREWEMSRYSPCGQSSLAATFKVLFLTSVARVRSL